MPSLLKEFRSAVFLSGILVGLCAGADAIGSPPARIVAFGDSTTAPRGSLPVYAGLIEKELRAKGHRLVADLLIARLLEGPDKTAGRIGNPSYKVREPLSTKASPVVPAGDGLRPQQYLMIRASGEAVVYNANWNVLQTTRPDAALPRLATGEQTIRFHCDFRGTPGPRVQVRFRTEAPGPEI
jgi:hypothetical protein